MSHSKTSKRTKPPRAHTRAMGLVGAVSDLPNDISRARRKDWISIGNGASLFASLERHWRSGILPRRLFRPCGASVVNGAPSRRKPNGGSQ
jgi:hypothetical protein